MNKYVKMGPSNAHFRETQPKFPRPSDILFLFTKAFAITAMK